MYVHHPKLHPRKLMAVTLKTWILCRYFQLLFATRFQGCSSMAFLHCHGGGFLRHWSRKNETTNRLVVPRSCPNGGQQGQIIIQTVQFHPVWVSSMWEGNGPMEAAVFFSIINRFGTIKSELDHLAIKAGLKLHGVSTKTPKGGFDLPILREDI